MIILGRNSDDKGTQLENLTRTLFRNLSYQNVNTNVVGGGGEEIDVTAEFPTPGIKTTTLNEVYAECKAYASPVALEELQKFLGKLFARQIISGRSPIGVFVALSGVTGNFRGHYEQIKASGCQIDLIDGDDLIDALRRYRKIATVEEMLAKLQEYTSRSYVNADAIYYNDLIFWFIEFPEGDYTILAGDLCEIEEDAITEIIPLIEKSRAVSRYIDLRKESEGRELLEMRKKNVVVQLFNGYGEAEIGLFNEADYSEPIKALVDDEIIRRDEDKLKLPDRQDYLNIHKLYSFLLNGKVMVEHLNYLNADLHLEYLNDHFLEYLLDSLGDLPLSENQKKVFKSLATMSPRVFRFSLGADEILNHRFNPDVPGRDVLDPLHVSYFMNTISELFGQDYNGPYLNELYFSRFGLRELETKSSFALKTATGVLVEGELQQRTILGELGEEYTSEGGHRFVRVMATPDAPQPWEFPTQEESTPIIDKKEGRESQ